MDPSDPRSRHVWEFLNVVEHVNPRAFVMENVMGLALNKRWEHLRSALIGKAEELGYQTTLLTLSAADFGVPQNRRRMFLIGIKDGGVMRSNARNRRRPANRSRDPAEPSSLWGAG